MSVDQKLDRARIEEAIRGAFEAVLPVLVSQVVARLDDTPSKSPRLASTQDLGPLFDAARTGGETALRARLERPLEDLQSVARALDRHLGDKVRRWKDVAKVRDAITAEILRRAWRNDVFLDSGEAREGGAGGSRKKGGGNVPEASEVSSDTRMTRGASGSR